MKLLCIRILFLLTILPSNAQVEGVIVNKNLEPIQYANIWNLDGSAGATTTIEGKYRVEKANDSDTLFINASGYYPLQSVYKDTLFLEPIISATDELIVYAERITLHTLGGAHVENLYFNPGNTPYMMARHFSHTKETQHLKYLDQVIFFAKSNVAEATVKIRILDTDEFGCPSYDLTPEPIIVQIRRGVRKNKVDLHPYHIKMPKNGVFVAVEWILYENNRVTKPGQYFKGFDIFQDYRYAPDLVSNRVEKPNGYRYMYGEWYANEQFLKPEEKTGEKPYIDPAIGLILSN